MNTRIEELTEQARDYADYYSTLSGESEQKIYTQKLAELIVQECCQKLENDGMVETAIELKWHFGIKE